MHHLVHHELIRHTEFVDVKPKLTMPVALATLPNHATCHDMYHDKPTFLRAYTINEDLAQNDSPFWQPKEGVPMYRTQWIAFRPQGRNGQLSEIWNCTVHGTDLAFQNTINRGTKICVNATPSSAQAHSIWPYIASHIYIYIYIYRNNYIHSRDRY